MKRAEFKISKKIAVKLITVCCSEHRQVFWFILYHFRIVKGFTSLYVIASKGMDPENAATRVADAAVLIYPFDQLYQNYFKKYLLCARKY